MQVSWRTWLVSVLCLGGLFALVAGAGALLPLLARLLQSLGIEPGEAMRQGGAGGYLKFVLEQGPLFTVTFAFISVIWIDLDKNEWLVSADPREYVAGCFWLVGGVFHGMAGIRGPRRAGDERQSATVEEDTQGADFSLAKVPLVLFSAFAFVIDTFLGLFVMFLLALLSLVWMLCAAPPLYFLTLISGAPARLSLRGSRDRRYLVEHAGQVEIEIENELAEIRWNRVRTTMEVTFSRRPVSLTNATATFVLGAAGAVVSLVEALSAARG